MGIIMKNGICYSTSGDSDSASLGTGWILYKTQTGSVAVDMSEIYNKATEFYVVAKAEGSNSNTLNSLITRNAIENGLERLSLGGDPNIALIEVSNTVFKLTYMKWTSVVTDNSVLEIYYKMAEAVVAPVIYSDTEREIGVWRDGKPLYQRTFVENFTGVGSVELIASGIEYAQQIDSSYVSGGILDTPFYVYGNASVSCYTEVQNGRMVLNNSYNGTIQWTVTIRYTKTADTAGSGTWTPSGVPAVHYSTDEQIIGTWVDGRPVYEVTLTVATTTQLNNISWTAIPFSETEPTGVDFIIDAVTTKNPPTNSQFRFKYENGHFCGASIETDSVNQGSYCIFRYVKTTS